MAAMLPPNRLRRSLATLDRLPAFLRRLVLPRLLGWHIPFTRTARLDYLALEPELVRVRLWNRRRVQNHIRSVHAAAAALLAETASGLALGMHLPDDRLPLLKSMSLRYLRRAKGSLVAEVGLTTEQIETLRREARGEVRIAVTVMDEAGEQPIDCAFVWAWIEKRRD